MKCTGVPHVRSEPFPPAGNQNSEISGNSGVHPGNSNEGVHPGGGSSENCLADNRGDGNFNLPCIFPFYYQGEIFRECTTTGWGRLWCASVVDENGNALSYGVCDCGEFSQNSQEDFDVDFGGKTESRSFLFFLGVGFCIGLILSFVVVIIFVLFLKFRKLRKPVKV